MKKKHFNFEINWSVLIVSFIFYQAATTYQKNVIFKNCHLICCLLPVPGLFNTPINKKHSVLLSIDTNKRTHGHGWFSLAIELLLKIFYNYLVKLLNYLDWSLMNTLIMNWSQDYQQVHKLLVRNKHRDKESRTYNRTIKTRHTIVWDVHHDTRSWNVMKISTEDTYHRII